MRAARRNIDDGNPAAPAFDAQIAELEAALAEPAPPAPSEAPAGDEDEEVLIASADGTMKLTQARSGIAFLDRAIEKWRENPSLMAYKLQANSYKFSWLLIPLSIPFVWLIFAWRRRFKAYDHAVFVTYSLCFMTLLFAYSTESVNGVRGKRVPGRPVRLPAPAGPEGTFAGEDGGHGPHSAGS